MKEEVVEHQEWNMEEEFVFSLFSNFCFTFFFLGSLANLFSFFLFFSSRNEMSGSPAHEAAEFLSSIADQDGTLPFLITSFFFLFVSFFTFSLFPLSFFRLVHTKIFLFAPF